MKFIKPEHCPSRGDPVEAWIKRERNSYDDRCSEWQALDNLLDDYRLAADTGQTLGDLNGETNSEEAG